MQLEGLIIKGIGGFYYVEAAAEIYECKAKGIFRKERITPVVGDRVRICVRETGQNTIEEILPRRNVLLRPPVANIDKLMIVASACRPNPNLLLIDRMTVLAERHNMEPVILFTKIDLQPCDDLIRIYRRAGFSCCGVSGVTGEGVDAVKAELGGCVCAFAGNTGVGKSTLLNSIDPSLALSTGEISDKLGRGRHTTRHVELFHVQDGFVADTPGFSSLDFTNGETILKEDLPDCFPEFRQYLGQCRFSTCSHIADRGCAIAEAVAAGEIGESRHQSYKLLYEEVKNRKEWQL